MDLAAAGLLSGGRGWSDFLERQQNKKKKHYYVVIQEHNGTYVPVAIM